MIKEERVREERFFFRIVKYLFSTPFLQNSISTTHLFSSRLPWQQAKEGSPDVPLSCNIQYFSFSWSIPRYPQARWDIWSLQCVLGLPQSFRPGGHAQKTSKGRHLGDIPIRCPNHLNSLLSTWKCSGSPTSSMKMSEPIFKDHCTQPCWGNIFWLLASTVSFFGPLP